MTAALTSTPSDSTDSLREVLLLLWAFVPCRVITISAEVGLFQRLSTADAVANGVSLDELEEQTKWARNGLVRVIDVLSAAGIVTWNGSDQSVKLTPLGQRWFIPGGTESILNYLERRASLESAYLDLPAVLTSGRASSEMQFLTRQAFGGDLQQTSDFLQTMAASGRSFCPDLAAILAPWLSIADKPMVGLDVGCGLGNVACAILEILPPESRIEAFDLPGVCSHTRNYLKNAGMTDRIFVQPSDWDDFDWPLEAYDFVILSQVLHERDEAGAANLLAAACATLVEGGLLIVVMVGDGGKKSQDLVHAIFSLNILVETGGFNQDFEWMRSRSAKFGVETILCESLTGARSVWVGRKL